MMKRMLAGLAAAALVSVLHVAPPAHAQGAPSESAAGPPASVRVTGSATTGVDPSVALGERRMKAERDARLDGAGKLSAAVRAMLTGSGETIEQVTARDESMRQRIDTFVQGAKVKATRFLPDGRVEVDIELDLTALPAILQGSP